MLVYHFSQIEDYLQLHVTGYTWLSCSDGWLDMSSVPFTGKLSRASQIKHITSVCKATVKNYNRQTLNIKTFCCHSLSSVLCNLLNYVLTIVSESPNTASNV